MALLLTILLGSGLPAGAHHVGYQRLQNGRSVSVWYPSSAVSDARRMTLRRYARDRQEELEAFLKSAGLSPEGRVLYLDSETMAVENATPLRRAFPMVVIAHGNGQDAADQALLAEHLASHGYIVASTPSPMLQTPMKSEEEIVPFAEKQAADLSDAIGEAAKLTAAIPHNVVVIGHSFGARAALLLAMRDVRVSALVSLDGGIGTATGAAEVAAAPSFDRKRTPPILHLYGNTDEFMKVDFAFLDSLGSPSLRKELIAGMRHAHFTTVGFAAANIPEMARLTRAQKEHVDGLTKLVRETLAFVKRYSAGRAVQTGRWSESGFSPARNEISAPSFPSSRHSKRFRTNWPNRSLEIPASTAASTRSRPI